MHQSRKGPHPDFALLSGVGRLTLASVIYMDVTSSCKSPMNTGVQRIVRNLHRALSAMTEVTPLVWDPALMAYCTLSRRERGFLEQPFAAGNARDAEPGRRANPIPLWSKFVRRITHRRNRLDLPASLTAADTLFVPEIFQDNRVAWHETFPARTSARRVGVCHDALPWRQPDLMDGASPAGPRRVGIFYDALTQRRPDITPPTRKSGFADYLQALGGFDHIVTISQESASDLRACWREQGCPDHQMPPVSVFSWPANHDGTPRKIVPPGGDGSELRSVLCVGTFEPRKNHLVLLDASEQLWQRGVQFELALIGRTTAHWGEQVLTVIERLQKAGRPVNWLKHVDDAALRTAYEKCAFTVFPSLIEGFGLPIVESLWHGRPCVCGQNGALGEVAAAGGCLLVDQADPAALATGMNQLLTDAAVYARLCEQAEKREFSSWEKLAADMLPVLQPA